MCVSSQGYPASSTARGNFWNNLRAGGSYSHSRLAAIPVTPAGETQIRHPYPMNKSSKTIITAAAIAGLYLGAMATKASAEKAKDGCKGKDGCSGKKEGKAHDCKGKNECKGKGGCGSSDNGCKGKNTCKGKGGCSSAMGEKHDANAKKKEGSKKS
jgi:hypothetical protein